MLDQKNAGAENACEGEYIVRQTTAIVAALGIAGNGALIFMGVPGLVPYCLVAVGCMALLSAVFVR